MPIPKSATPARRLENLDVDGFSLDDEDMGSIGQLSKPGGRLSDAHPARHEEF